MANSLNNGPDSVHSMEALPSILEAKGRAGNHPREHNNWFRET